MILNKRIFVGALSAVLMLLSVCGLSAQEVSSLSMRELQNEAQGYIKQKRYIDARPYLEELVLRTNESASASLKSNLAEYYYFWAYGYLQEYANSSNPDDLKKAIAKFETGIKEFPMSNYANASIETMARCYDSLRDFAAATNTRKMLLEKPYVDRLNYAAQLGIIKKIAETLYVNREWKLGLEWFQMLFDRSKDPNDKVFAASALVQADIANEDYEAVKKYIPYMVYDVPARYDIALSLAFLTAGDALAKKRQFSDAALFYNMVLSKESIASNINRFLADAKKKLERINRTSPGSEIAVNLDNTVKYYEAVLKMVEGVRSYDSDIMAREGNNYLQTKRMYESFWSFWRIIKEYPDSEGEDAFYYAAIESALNIGKDEAMHDLAVEYIEKYPDGDHIVPVKLRLAQYLLKKKEYDSFFELTKQFIDDYYDDDKARIDAESIDAKVLSNRKPPYGIKGGLFDALTDTGGDILVATNEEARAAKKLFAETEGVDIYSAPAVALATLIKCVHSGTIDPEKIIMLNVTGGGEKRFMAGKKLYYLKPSLVFHIDPDVNEVIEKVNKLFD